MAIILDYCPRRVPNCLGERNVGYEEWLQLVGNAWTECDIITPYAQTLKEVLGVDGPLREMMDEKENEAYNALPETVTIYRGCDAERSSGICWTLDEQIANSFPFLHGFETKAPLLIRAEVKKKHILAVKLDRAENEVITFSANYTSICPADEPAAREFLCARDAKHAQVHA